MIGTPKPSKSQYVIGIPSHWKYIRLYEADRDIAGFLSDFTVELASKMKIGIKFVTIEPEDLPGLFDNGTIDACYSAIPQTPYTNGIYLFSDPIFINGTVVVVSQQSPFHSLSDLHGATIAFDNSMSDITMGAKESWLLSPSESVIKSLDNVYTGTIDGVILNYMQARFLTKSLFSARYRILLPPLVSENIHLIVLKNGTEDLIPIVNKFRAASLKDGSYAELLQYWNIDVSMGDKAEH